MISERKTKIHAYNGPPTERTVADCEKEWQKLGIASLDEILLDRFLSANCRESKVITIVDIGCGKRSHLLDGIMHDPNACPDARTYMGSNIDISLNLVGLTDCEEKEDFGRPLVQESVWTPDMRAEHKAIAYTLTPFQEISQFYERVGIERLDVAFATWSLAYLSPTTFAEVVNSTIRRLMPGGVFIAAGYNDTVSGHGFTYHPENDILHFSNRQNIVWEKFFSEFQSSYSPNEEVDPEVRLYFRKIVNSPGMGLDGEKKDVINAALDIAQTCSDIEVIARDLMVPIKTLWERKFTMSYRPKKKSVLDGVVEEFGDVELKRVSPNLFYIKKQEVS